MESKRLPYAVGPVIARSMPFWCVANPLSDPFGEGVLESLSSLLTCELICGAAKDGLIEKTGFHDDDLVKWDPCNPEDDLDEKGNTWNTLQQIKEMLTATGVRVNTATCNLHGNRLFRRGGLTNPDPTIRELARLKTERTLRIGNLLRAEYFTYWVARDGWEVAIEVPWADVYDWIAKGLNNVHEYIRRNNLSNYVGGGTIEPKPNEPRGHMFLPTAGHAVGFILTKLRTPDFWGVNPELRQHEAMSLLDPLTAISYLVSMGKLSFLHLGNQISGQFDNDFPPLVGPEGLKETILMFWLLGKLNWKGAVEFDCHMLRSEADPSDQIGCRKRFIANCSTALQIALELSARVYEMEATEGSREATEGSRGELFAATKMCGLNFYEVQKRAKKQYQ